MPGCYSPVSMIKIKDKGTNYESFTMRQVNNKLSRTEPLRIFFPKFNTNCPSPYAISWGKMLPKSSTIWVGCNNVTDADDRRTDLRRHDERRLKKQRGRVSARTAEARRVDSTGWGSRAEWQRAPRPHLLQLGSLGERCKSFWGSWNTYKRLIDQTFWSSVRGSALSKMVPSWNI